MNRPYSNIDSYPSKSQKLLLKAVFTSDREMLLNYWEKWYAEVDIEDLDSESNHLLPLLSHNLSLHQVKTKEDQRLKGIYRRYWYSNQISLAELNKILIAFNEEQIKTIILGDLAMAVGYYSELAMRPIYNYELFVTPQQSNLAIKLLTQLGWKPKFEIKKINPYLYPKLPFTNNQGKVLFLYWQLWTYKLDLKNQETIFTDISKKITIGENIAYILNPTAQIVYLCWQNSLCSEDLIARYLIDLKYIIDNSNSGINWQQLITKILALNLSLGYQNLVLKLNEILVDRIPSQVVIDAQKLTITILEKYEFKLVNNQNRAKFKNRLGRLYFTYVRTSAQNRLFLSPLKFSYYLKYMWELESLWALPKKMILKLFL